MFAWIEAIEKKLHDWKAKAESDIADIKARLDALEGKTPAVTPAVTPAPTQETPPVQAAD